MFNKHFLNFVWQIGSYDPYSDDPQLGIQKIAICCQAETLVLGGTAGQIIVLKFAQTSQKLDIQVGWVINHI